MKMEGLYTYKTLVRTYWTP